MRLGNILHSNCTPIFQATTRLDLSLYFLRQNLILISDTACVLVHATSAPQLTLEYSSRVIANASDGVDGERTLRAMRTPVPTRGYEAAAGLRRGMRPLLLPQKLGLLTIGATSGWDQNEAERIDSWSSVRHESRVTGWDIDLERGV